MPPPSTRRAPLALAAALSALVALAAASCNRGTSAPAPAASASASASAPSSAAPPASQDSPRGDDDIRPVYPPTKDPPDPRALKYCEALQITPAARRAACCGEAPSPPPATAGECARMLSSALRSGALTLAAEDVDRCADAVARAHEGCGWVDPSPQPLPPACQGLLHGTLKAGARCRSSLECEGNQRCHGLGPTDLGTCNPPGARGARCGTGADPLAAFARQADVDTTHPECAGYCALRRCADPQPAGAACKSHLACGPGALCIAGQCASGQAEQPAAAGEPCPAGACRDGARCLKGTCVAPRGEGEPCEQDAECRGACNPGDAGAAGTCGMRCAQPGFPGR